MFAKVITGEEEIPVLEDIEDEKLEKLGATGEDLSSQTRAKAP